jgi:Phosphotransferase enzyme family
MMKNSIHSGITPSPVFDCDFIQTAQLRVAKMHASAAHPVEPPTLVELEQALGEGVQRYKLWTQNWRNRVYRIELASGRAALAKQAVRGTEAMVQYQYDQLQRLSKLEIPAMRVPKALAFLRAKRVYVMEFAPGKTIESLLWTRSRRADLLLACELAGKVLAQMHILRTEKISPMPVEPLARDLAAAPWQLSSREQKILQSALRTFSRAELRMGEIYYDYKPANLLFDINELFLVDPPDMVRQGAHLRDFVAFQSSMRRHLWRLSWRRPFDPRRTGIRQGMAAFEGGYLANIGIPYPEPKLFAPVVRFFELQRTAVLMTMQRGKVDAARQKMPVAHNARLGNSLANRITLPLLEMEKRWLFRQLAHELPM